METQIKQFDGYSDELLECVCSLEERIFDPPHTREKLLRDYSSKQQLLGLVAFSGNVPVAYKTGYEMTSLLYYSWHGGVVKEHRKAGLASLLMKQQHELVSSMGYKVIRTHTKNQFRDMLVLNIRNGFDVVGLISEMKSSEPTIVLDKNLG